MRVVKRRRKSRRAKRGIYVSKKTGQVCRYRSNWERLFLSHIDLDDAVTHWIYEPFTIPYEVNSRSRRVRKYRPDVYLERSGVKQLVEIKPSKKLVNRVVMKKAVAARSWCESRGIEYIFVTEIELKKLGLL